MPGMAKKARPYCCTCTCIYEWSPAKAIWCLPPGRTSRAIGFTSVIRAVKRRRLCDRIRQNTYISTFIIAPQQHVQTNTRNKIVRKHPIWYYITIKLWTFLLIVCLWICLKWTTLKLSDNANIFFNFESLSIEGFILCKLFKFCGLLLNPLLSVVILSYVKIFLAYFVYLVNEIKIIKRLT